MKTKITVLAITALVSAALAQMQLPLNILFGDATKLTGLCTVNWPSKYVEPTNSTQYVGWQLSDSNNCLYAWDGHSYTTNTTPNTYSAMILDTLTKWGIQTNLTANDTTLAIYNLDPQHTNTALMADSMLMMQILPSAARNPDGTLSPVNIIATPNWIVISTNLSNMTRRK